MVKVRTLLGVVALALTMSASQAATLLETDFSQNSTGWVLNGTAQLLDPQTAGVTQLLSLTQHEGSQTGTAWTEIAQQVPSFSFTADMRIRWDAAKAEEVGSDTSCPADGIAMVFAPVATDAQGTGGGGLGLIGLETFTAFELNTWRGQGLGDETQRATCDSGNHVTFAFDVFTPETADPTRVDGVAGTPETGGAKIGQVVPPSGMQVVNGGLFRYQWNVAEDGTMAVYVTGLEDSNNAIQKVKVLEVKFPSSPINFEGRWGLTAATGGATQYSEVLRARIDSPMIEPL
jgi:hypothetical protein